MKKIYSLLALGMLVAVFLACPLSVHSQTEDNSVLTVTYNNNSGISYASYTGTLADGSVLGFLGFNSDGSDVFFCGAISSATSLSVPEKISYNGTEYTVNYCGYFYQSTLDFDEAASVTSLTLPSTITSISGYIPSTITDLHLQSETPPSVGPYLGVFSNATVWVPQTALSAYQSLTVNSNNGWFGVNVVYEGWQLQSYTVTVNTAGTFGNVLLATVDQWTDVDELTVIGHLNEDDLKLLTRLKQMRKLDLSQTDISVMTGCSGLTLLQEVLLPSTVTEIDDVAFSGCKKLTEINAPNATSIGGSAFSDCSSLSTVSLPAATSIGGSAFFGCSSLSTVSLPAATSIGGSAFYHCSSLSTASLPAATSIGGSAFFVCFSLSTVSLPAATSIGGSAFFGCSSLSTVSLPAATSIGRNAFSDCSSLSTVSLPAAISIGGSAFSDCSSLSTVSLPAAISIGENAFYPCSSLSTVSLPAAISIGEKAFFHCSSLSTVSLPAATSIGGSAFSGCSSLSTVSMPATTSIGDNAFRNCSSLSMVSLPAVTSIGRLAFYRCSGLSTVSLPACLQELGTRAFLGCSNLKDVYCRAVVPLSTSAFSREGNSATLHVPAFSLTAYMLSDSWNVFYQIVPLDETITELHVNSAFTITSFDGLADKVDVTLAPGGQLTVSANSTFNLGSFVQQQGGTMLTNSEIKADNVSLSMKVSTNCWNFISLPFDVNVADITYTDSTLWVIRKYSGADRAALTGNTWQNMSNDTVLKAGEGYVLHCANEGTNTVEFVFKAVDNAQKNNIFTCQDVVKPLATYASEHAHNSSWNLVGNPYPAYFNTHCIEHNGVITVYNGNYYYSGGNYTAYSLIDDDYVLAPNQAFFVQCPADANSMTFKAEGRMHDYSISQNEYTRAPRKLATLNSNRQVYNFTLTDGSFTDRARLVINPEAKMDYEISCDASKFMSDNTIVPQLYVFDNGIRYAIDERPLGNGNIILGAHFGQAGQFTIALNTKAVTPAAMMLTDHETGNKVNLCEEAYTFTAQAGTAENRFTLSVGGVATGIGEASHLMQNEESNNLMFDLQGRKVNDGQQKGIYIIKQNGQSRKVLK